MMTRQPVPIQAKICKLCGKCPHLHQSCPAFNMTCFYYNRNQSLQFSMPVQNNGRVYNSIPSTKLMEIYLGTTENGLCAYSSQCCQP